MGLERNNFDTVAENITEAENSILFDESNNISTNKLAVIPAQCRDKGNEDMQMPFFGLPICNYPMTEHSFNMMDETFQGKKGNLNGRILLGFKMTVLTTVLGKNKHENILSRQQEHNLIQTAQNVLAVFTYFASYMGILTT